MQEACQIMNFIERKLRCSFFVERTQTMLQTSVANTLEDALLVKRIGSARVNSLAPACSECRHRSICFWRGKLRCCLHRIFCVSVFRSRSSGFEYANSHLSEGAEKAGNLEAGIKNGGTRKGLPPSFRKGKRQRHLR